MSRRRTGQGREVVHAAILNSVSAGGGIPHFLTLQLARRTRDLLLRRRGHITSKSGKLLSFLDGARDHAGLSCLSCRPLPGYLESKLESGMAGDLLCKGSTRLS
jgi:hypothetical protein